MRKGECPVLCRSTVSLLETARTENASLLSQLKSLRNTVFALFADVSIVDSADPIFKDVSLLKGPDQVISKLRHDSMKSLRHSIGVFDDFLSPEVVLGASPNPY